MDLSTPNETDKNPFPLPRGWIKIKISQIADTKSGGTPSTFNKEFWNGDIPWINSGALKDAIVYEPSSHITKHAIEKSAAKIIPKNSVLIALTGATTGKIGLLNFDSTTNQSVVGILPNTNFEPKYLFYFFIHSRESVLKKAIGTAQPHINKGIVDDFGCLLAPLPEQHRIVTKIEELFTQLDAGVAPLKKAQTQLKRYRQAVLKAAFEGRLTKEWREEHAGEIEPAETLIERIEHVRQKIGSAKKNEKITDFSYLDPLPNTWSWLRLDNLAFIKGGITKDSKRIVENGRPVPYLRVANVQNGYLNLQEMKTIEASEDEIHNLSLKIGDILFTEGGDRDKLGRGWIWQNEIPDCIYQNHIFRARLYLDEISPKYVSWFGNTHSQKYFMRQGKQTTNLASISLTQLRAFPVALPPIAEQKEIINEIERHFSQIDHLENIITTSLQQSESLHQSILKRAFEGKLVPQDPNDEPASILLERIKAEKVLHQTKAKSPKKPKRKIKNGN